MIKRIAVFTSGGDSPGMNAAIRAVVRASFYYHLEIFGIKRGYDGMINGEFAEMNLRSVSNTIQTGGTILKTSRSKDFQTVEGRQKAIANLDKFGIDGIIGIGGNGTLTGLQTLASEWNGKIIGLPGTIDNDLYGTDFTIGFHTAVTTALDAIDKIRDTAASHERIFIIEVMGREAGFIATDVGISGGCEEILIPEKDTDILECAKRLKDGMLKGKTSSIIVVAEGGKLGGAYDVANKLSSLSNIGCRVVIIGHIQRGGSPTFYDRVLASELGVYAVEKMMEGATNVMAGEINGKCEVTLLSDAISKRKPVDPFKLKIARILSI